MTATVLHGDCLDVLRSLPDCSVDAVVTDPPAGIAFMGKAWDGNRGGRDLWVAWLAERLAECLRVLKPGGHAVVWALPRTSGWTHRALEDAGFEVRDCLTHLFGQGFPKSLDVGKAIDKAAGAERMVAGVAVYADGHVQRSAESMGYGGCDPGADLRLLTAPATDAAREWDGWGTALKPAAEFWYLARKPLAGTVAANVVEWGTGAINIDASRVGMSDEDRAAACVPNGKFAGSNNNRRHDGRNGTVFAPAPAGRWPANVALTHHPDCDGGCVDGCPIAELDRQAPLVGSKLQVGNTYATGMSGQFFGSARTEHTTGSIDERSGASCFFPTFKYQAKPSTREKNGGLDDLAEQMAGTMDGGHIVSEGRTAPKTGRRPAKNHHPTVKPVELMRWLIRLVTPPGGVVLDPFAGSGSTLVAATLEGFDSVGIEFEAEYLPIIEGRVRWAECQDQQQTLDL